jgi:hypothetical protein
LGTLLRLVASGHSPGSRLGRQFVHDDPHFLKHRVRFHISSAPTAQRVRRAYSPCCVGEVFSDSKAEGRMQNAENGSSGERIHGKMKLRVNNGQTNAVKPRLWLGGETGVLPISSGEHKGETMEIHRRFTGDMPEHHHRSTLPPRSAQRLPPRAHLLAGAAGDSTVNHRFE